MTRILVTGSAGQIARSLAALSGREFQFVAIGRPELELADPRTVARVMEEVDPAAVVNAAAYTAVDQAESDETPAFAINRDGAGAVASAAAEHGIPVVHLSTDYVFSGDKNAPYEESDPVGPMGVYGHSKLEGERAVAAANPAHVILRTAWVYGPYGNNFLKTMLRLARDRDVVRVVADQHGTPTAAPDIAEAISAVLRQVLNDPESEAWRGVFHMVAGGETTWAGFAKAIFEESEKRGGPSARVEPIATQEYPTPARRPANSRLSTARFQNAFGHALPPWREGVAHSLDVLLAPSAARS